MADHDDDVFEETSPIEPSHPESDTAPIEESSIDQQKVYILNISTGYNGTRIRYAKCPNMPSRQNEEAKL